MRSFETLAPLKTVVLVSCFCHGLGTWCLSFSLALTVLDPSLELSVQFTDFLIKDV